MACQSGAWQVCPLSWPAIREPTAAGAPGLYSNLATYRKRPQLRVSLEK